MRPLRPEPEGIDVAIVNTRLLSHPMNYIIIGLMLTILAVFGHLVLTILDQEPATATGGKKGLPTGYTFAVAPSV